MKTVSLRAGLGATAVSQLLRRPDSAGQEGLSPLCALSRRRKFIHINDVLNFAFCA